ncbi:MAG TPA: hypothetical protein VIF15_19545 [Polyangiaceae bacterium]|jgi:hypothetical protein
MGEPRRARSRIVPKSVFQATFAGVVPICVAAAACGGQSTGNTGGDAAIDGKDDVQYLGVGCIGFDGGCGGVAVDAFGGPDQGAGDAAGDASDGSDAQDSMPLGVACCAFDGSDA